MIEPKLSALIIIDMQNDFCREDGHYGKCGRNLEDIKKIIPNLHRLINEARRRGVLIVYIQNTQLPNGASLSPPIIANMLKRWKEESKLSYTVDGTWGQEIIEDLKPEKNDLIVKKYRPSAFTGTNLDMILRSCLKETVIIGGVVTEGCVESTARDALMKDYYVVIAEDCIASASPITHENQLKVMKEIYHFVVPSTEILNIWST